MWCELRILALLRRTPVQRGPQAPYLCTNAARDSSVDPSERAFEEKWINHHFKIALAEIRRTFAPESVALSERLMRGEPVEAITAVDERRNLDRSGRRVGG